MAFVEMDFASGGGSKMEMFKGSFTPNTSSQSSIQNCGFKPTKIYMFFYTNGSTICRTLDTENETFMQEVNGGTPTSITQFYNNVVITDNGFSFKAMATDDAKLTYYIAVKE